ncbi:ATP-binding protein [Roseibium algae]|uniref:histidine kinase n=1 Tax=Roseibium algae TaxID=3123038 RepID=A0ABU8TM86_9HYPH
MRSLFDRLVPRRIAGQLLMVMMITVVIMALIFAVVYYHVKEDFPDKEFGNLALRHVVAVTLLNETDASLRQEVLSSMKVADPTLSISLLDDISMPTLTMREAPIFWPYGEGALGDDIELLTSRLGGAKEGDETLVQLFFRLRDGTYLCVDLTRPEGPPVYGNPVLLLVLGLSICLVMLLDWRARTLVRPLEELSNAVASFGMDSTQAVPIAESGSLEVQQAARAFNRMQARIQDLIERRTRMLTAIGHDLRTPLTRLRLRIALMTDEDQKLRNLADLDLMETQLNGALSYLREGRTGEGTNRIDLPSLLQGLVDQYEDMGVTVSLVCPTGLTVEARCTELIRAFSNLIENARRYDDQLSIHVVLADAAFVHVDVIDHGPGIPVEERERLMEPFERGDVARPIESGASLGLGLAITNAIALAHGGSLELLGTPGGGLTARIVIPLAPSSNQKAALVEA